MQAKKILCTLSSILLITLAVTNSAAQAAQVSLSWTAPITSADGSPLTDLAGYKVYYGYASRQYSVDVNAGSPTTATFSGLKDAKVYYFAVTAYDISGNESAFSTEVSYDLATVDTDKDGLSDWDELNLYGTDPDRADTDGDGFSDGMEVAEGSDPLNPASTPSLKTEIRINFQPASAPVPQGYQKDNGAVYSSAQGYGWDKNLQGATRDRNVNPDQRLDTFVYAGAGMTATWSYDLPNGEYLLSLAVGDPSYSQGPHRVEVEGVLVINGGTTAANQYITVADVPIIVADGQLSVKIGSTSGNSMLNYLVLKPTEPITEIRINFQPASAPVPQGYQKDDGAVYSSAQGYGWDKNLQGATRDRNVNPDQRLDTFVYAGAGMTATWSYDLPNGEYLLSLAVGDPSYSQGPHRVEVEGVLVINGGTTAANQYITVADVPIIVADGQLSVKIGGTSGNSMLNYLVLKPTE